MKDVDWKKKCQELENEMVLIKGITITNSPELRAANARIKEIEDGLANAVARIGELEEINEGHKNINGNLRREITVLEQEKLELYADNKKLASQVEDYVDQLRKAAVI
tara:strand:+ start:304 stop:627 length:324 start_codon:yes stop_codon:yes gene_type:complete